jgi:hypothetical protein
MVEWLNRRSYDMSDAASPTAPEATKPVVPAPAGTPAPAAAPSTALTLTTNDGKELSYDYGQYAGEGSSALPTSGFLPFLSVLQPLSKACIETSDKFVPGARPGMFLLGGDENRLFDGKKGMIFVPIHDRHTIIEKTSLDGKGKIIARHDGDPKGQTATAMRAKFGTDKSKWKSDAGHFMVERHDLTGVLFNSMEDVAAMKPVAAVIVGFERTKLRAFDRISKGFNKYEPRKRPPLFALMVQLSTAAEKGEKGDYYNIVVKFPVQDDFARSLIPPTAPGFGDWAKQASEVYKAVSSGAIQAKEDGDEDHPVGDDGGKGSDIPF